MKTLYYFTLFLATCNTIVAQNISRKNSQTNWQQHVSYKIDGSLNDMQNSISAFESIIYTNNSPNQLNEIYFHLWPNAYRNTQTAFAKQQLENNTIDFYFSKPESRGFIDSLDFKVNGKSVKWAFQNDIDICKIELNEPLLPGNSIEITTPFFVKIPSVFSRMGVENGTYCITQWYPKPAVYDVNGWNPIPYLDQGEFYSEFGSFDVSISVPKNYVVAATGNLQNEEEKLFLNTLATKPAAEYEVPPISSNEFKTLRYIQDSVHDFAWFASKEFNVKKGEIALQNGKTIETWLFAKNINAFGVDYINEGVKYYSDHIGNYPYNLAQVVITPLEAGGGMEYPTITNCASIDRTTIIHEVGHNWFYGILGSNEREHPWMDESLNTYYESRCSQEKKDAEIAKNGKKKDLMKDVFNLDIEAFGQSRFLYSISARKNEDQAGNLPATAYTDFNYGAIIYAKNPLSFYMLQNYLGNEIFDAMMHAYYEKWKFKHPLPNDFRNHAEEFTGKNLTWFFDELLSTNKKVDYKLSAYKNGNLQIKNITGTSVPFSISDTSGKTKWFDGVKKDTVIYFQSNNKIILDEAEKTLELYRQNNQIKTKGIFKTCSPTSISFFPKLESSTKKQVFIMPAYGWNFYNGNMYGAIISNNIFPAQKTDFTFVPLYSSVTNNWNGYASFAKNIYPKTTYRRVQIGINIARFASQGIYQREFLDINKLPYTIEWNGNISYEKIDPFIELDFAPKSAKSFFSNTLKLRYVMINETELGKNYFDNFDENNFSFVDITHLFSYKNVLYPSSVKLNTQICNINKTSGRVGLEANQSFMLDANKETLDIRFFAGMFLSDPGNSTNEQRIYFQAGAVSGTYDYMYDQAMFGRVENNQRETFFARQIINRDAGFRNFVPIGQSKSWLTALNFTVPFPKKMPFGFYADFVFWESPEGYTRTVQNGITTNVRYSAENKFSYAGGIYFRVSKNVCEFYFPLFASSDINTYWSSNGFEHPFERVSFILNLNAINPVKFVRNLKF